MSMNMSDFKETQTVNNTLNGIIEDVMTEYNEALTLLAVGETSENTENCQTSKER